MTHARGSLARFDTRLRGDADALFGVDEVGRGCLAGPVVAAAVVLPPRPRLAGVDDSKLLSPERREEQARAIRGIALAIGFSFVGPREIERTNIRRASLLAMRRAVRRAAARLRAAGAPAALPRWLVLVDGDDPIPDLDLGEQRPLVDGDARSLAVAAASIIAKTVRDRFMRRLADEFPGYGFDRHVGYGTEEHLAALHLHGPCRWHRHTFAPVAQRDLFASMS